MKTMLMVLCVCALLIVPGCQSFLPQKQAKDDQGRDIFKGADGKATTAPTDPKTGLPNQPLQLYDEEKIKAMIDAAKQTSTSVLPQPFGEIGAGILTLVNTGVLAFAANANRKRRKEAGLAEKVKAANAATA